MHKLTLTALAAALLLLPACPRETVDRCSGADPHPECDNNVPGDMNNMPGDAGDVGNNMPGDAGDMTVPPDLGPCGMECQDPTPICDADSGMCVACVGNDDCTDGVCADDNTCVQCLADTDCNDGVCDTTSNACVDCVDNDDCTNPTASFCDTASNTCTSCTTSDDCSHLTDTTICDTGGAEGACVECLDDDDTTRAACMGNSCDPATNTCTTTATESVDTCESCVADSECQANQLCVPLDFEATPNGAFCLEMFGACERPYGVQIVGRATTNGVVQDFCGIAEMTTTCEAVRAIGDDCAATGPLDCAVDGALCETVSGISDTCTIACSNGTQCPTGLGCAGYCGGM